jgi:hypothetical protein
LIIPRLSLLIFFLLLLSACVSNVPQPGPGGDSDAVYVRPQTHEIRHCDNPGMGAAFRGGILAANAYADCKTAAEEQGFVRRREQGSN